MAKKDRYYRKLPGIRRLFLNWRLWLAPDHLLLVRQRTFSENYRRFYFSDIESFSICETTTRRKSIPALLLIGGILGAIAAWSYYADQYFVLDADRYFVLNLACVLLGVVVFLLARTILLGPTCVCELRTAVQAVELKSLRRLRKARKIERIIIPLIQAAQGLVSPEQLGADNPQPVSVAASRFAIPVRQEKDIEIHHESGRYHLLFFLVFFLGAPSGIFDIYYRSAIKDQLDAILAGACLILAVIALVKQARSDLPSAVKYLVWAGVLLIALEFGLALTVATISAMIDPLKYLEHPMTNLRQLVSAPVFSAWCGLFAAASAVISVFGVLRLSQFRPDTVSAVSEGLDPASSGESNHEHD